RRAGGRGRHARGASTSRGRRLSYLIGPPVRRRTGEEACGGPPGRGSLGARPRGARVTGLGAGSRGTALAVNLARIGHEVRLWARQPDFARSIAAAAENEVYLPGVRFPANVAPTGDLGQACAASEMIVFVCPSSGVRTLAQTVRPFL